MLGGKGKEGSLPTVFPKVNGVKFRPLSSVRSPNRSFRACRERDHQNPCHVSRWFLTHFGPEPRPLVTGPGADSEIWFKERRFVRLAGPRAGDMGGECMPLGEGRTPG